MRRDKKVGEGPDGRANSVANLVGFGERSCGLSDMGPCVGHAIFLFPPAPLSAAPTLNQLRLLGFSFLSSFFLGLAFSDVLSFSLQVIMGHNQVQMVWECARDGGISLHKFRSVVALYQFELLLNPTTLGHCKPSKNDSFGH